MRNRHIRTANHVLYHQGASGYLKRCYCCGQTIYLKRDVDGVWRPYESWAAGNVGIGAWRRHTCGLPEVPPVVRRLRAEPGDTKAAG